MAPIRCDCCYFTSETNPCGGCAAQAERLQIDHETLKAMAKTHSLGGLDPFLAQAIKVGLLRAEYQ